jgi:enterochelin esterase family protein
MIAALLALTLSSSTIDDPTYGAPRRVWVYTSPGAEGHPHNLLILLGGETYMDDFALPAMLEPLVASGKVPPTVAVMVDTSAQRPADLANSPKFDAFVMKTLLPFIRARAGGLPEPRRVTVCGFSVGGLTAAYLAFRHPDVFGNVLSQSGAFWRGPSDAPDPPEWLTEQLRTHPRLPIRFYLEVGGAETRILDANRHLRDVLAARKYVFAYTEVPGAKHDVAHWRTALWAGVVYLGR